MSKTPDRDRELMKSIYDKRLIVESDFPNAFYEIRGNYMRVTVMTDTGRFVLTETYSNMKAFAKEMMEVAEEWETL